MRYLFFMLVLMTCWACKKDKDCQEHTISGDNSFWYALIGSDTTTPNFPDYYANYYIYNFDRSQLKELGICIDGAFGDARYMSYNVYNFESGIGVATLVDKNIVAGACSYNPFSQDNSEVPNKNYRIYIVPQTAASVMEGMENVLYFPDSIDTLSIFFRYYVPRPNANAGVDLPYISAFDYTKKTQQPAPTQIAQNFEENIDELVAQVESFLQVQIDSQLRFYNVNASGMFTNLDADYLATPITVAADEVYLIRFRAPTFNIAGDAGDVRYWSINIGDGRTHIRYALKDEDAIIAADGFVNIVIAEDTPANRAKAAGLNFVPLSIPEGEPMGIIYRNLITHPNFVGAIDSVPVMDTEPISVLVLDAKRFIDEYAPRGIRTHTQAYLQNFGNFPVSY